MTSHSDSPPARRIPLVLVPLVVYLGVTLVAPGLNGAGRRDGFWEHAVITLGLSGLLGWPWFVACRRASTGAVTDTTAATKERA